MTDAEEHPYVEWIAHEARRSVTTDQAARARIMELVRAEPLPSPHHGLLRRLLQPRALSMSPIASVALAAGLIGIGVVAGSFVHRRDGLAKAGQPPVVARSVAGLPVSDTVVKFVLVAPQAGEVSIVGDFNDWNAKATPMTRVPQGAVWSVTLPLGVGRHEYAFVVDSQWITDPRAPLAPDDGFGHANSVVLVRRGSGL